MCVHGVLIHCNVYAETMVKYNVNGQSVTYQLGNQWYRLPSRSNVRHAVDGAVERIVAWMSVTNKDFGSCQRNLRSCRFSILAIRCCNIVVLICYIIIPSPMFTVVISITQNILFTLKLSRIADVILDRGTIL